MKSQCTSISGIGFASCGILLACIILAGVCSGCRGGSDEHQRTAEKPATQLGARIEPGFPVTLTDALGRTVTMPHKPRRIISLAPSATETLYAIGAGDRIVADTSVDDYPLAAVALPKVGGYSDPSVEKILFYKPDLVVAFRGNPSSLIDMLDKLSIPVFAIDPVTVAGISDSIRDVGRLVGSSERAEKVSGDLERRVRTVEEKVARLHRPAPPGLLEVWYDNGVTAAGPRTFMGDVFRVAGAKNVVSGGSSDYPRLSAEAVISLNPQCLFLTEEQPKPGMVAARPGWRQVAAVKAQRIYTIDASIVSRPGPRIAQAIERIETDLYSPADRRR